MPGKNDPIWQALASHRTRLADKALVQLFREDPDRARRLRMEAAGITLDYSKNLVTDETLNLFSRLIEANVLPHQIQQMVDGAEVNPTERRPALHTLLRTQPGKAPARLRAEAEAITDALVRIEQMANDIRSGHWAGAGGTPITDILHLGIGGSNLGPEMVSAALETAHDRAVNCHYVANVDGHHIDRVLNQLNPRSTLLVIASKSFSTQETLLNAKTARAWLANAVGETDLAHHLIAVTGNSEAASRFGVAPANALPMWDWVGGRFSLWSAVGITTAIAFGFRTFRALLDGAAAMDLHFKEAPWPDNLPMMLALLGIWYSNFYDAESCAVMPYDHGLRLLPNHLQQLDMESNGKSVDQKGKPIDYNTGPIVWGGEGSNGQHAFLQLLHQGTRLVPVDFILPLRSHHNRTEHHDWLVANCLAQSQALMTGRAALQDDGASAHRALPGNHPSNMILVDRITPETLGAIIAMYEHKVFCQAMIWHINPFDQWGVELGKEIGDAIFASFDNETDEDRFDPSTRLLIKQYLAKRKK